MTFHADDLTLCCSSCYRTDTIYNRLRKVAIKISKYYNRWNLKKLNEDKSEAIPCTRRRPLPSTEITI